MSVHPGRSCCSSSSVIPAKKRAGKCANSISWILAYRDWVLRGIIGSTAPVNSLPLTSKNCRFVSWPSSGGRAPVRERRRGDCQFRSCECQIWLLRGLIGDPAPVNLLLRASSFCRFVSWPSSGGRVPVREQGRGGCHSCVQIWASVVIGFCAV